MKRSLLITLILSICSACKVFGYLPIIAEVTKIDEENNCLTLSLIKPSCPPVVVKVAPEDFKADYLEKKIKGILITEFRPLQLRNISLYDPEYEKQVEEINQLYSRNSSTPQFRSLIKIGKPAPPFALYDQDGNTITNKNLEGKIVVMNFIFTRCAVPTLCPAATKKMAELQKLIKQQGLHNNVKFITISFDPENDTPEVLKQYAKGFDIDLSSYSFLTGDCEMIKRLAKLYGILMLSRRGTINHTMKTVIIDKTGRLNYITSKAWEPEKLLSIIKKI